MTWLKYERMCGPKCRMGHPMRPGPMGLMICDECTELALMEIRLKR